MEKMNLYINSKVYKVILNGKTYKILATIEQNLNSERIYLNRSEFLFLLNLLLFLAKLYRKAYKSK